MARNQRLVSTGPQRTDAHASAPTDLDLLCDLERLVRGNARLAVTQDLLHELCDASSSDRDVLDGRPDDVALRLVCAGARGRAFQLGGFKRARVGRS